MLLKDLLRIATRETHKLPEILADNFNLYDKQIAKILKEEYQKPKSDYRVLCGCFSVIWGASQRYPRISYKVFRDSYHLINKGLQDRRVSVKRLATLAILGIICKIYLHWLIHANEDDGSEITAEIAELKKNIKYADFLNSFNSLFISPLEKRIVCETAGIRVEALVTVSKSMLG